MHLLKNRPWLLGITCLMALNLWVGCNEKPAKQPLAKKESTTTEDQEKVPADSIPNDEKSIPDEDPPKDPIDKTVAVDKEEPASTGAEPPVSHPAEKPTTEKPHAETPPAEVPADQTPTAPKENAPKENEYGQGSTELTAEQKKDPLADWPKDCEALLILSGDQHGYIEPCGCAGLENQKGGLKRRHTFVKQLEEQGWPVTLLDMGEQIRRFGVQPGIKFRIAIQSLNVIGYKAIGFGPQDLQLPAEQLLLLDLPADKSLFVSANVKNAYAPEAIVPYKVVTAGKKKIGVTTILGDTYREHVKNEAIEITPAVDAINELLPKLQAEADFLVLMSNSTLEEAKALGKQFPQFDLVVTSSGADEPPLDSRIIEGTEKTYLVDLASKGMFVAAVGLFDDAENPLRYQRIPLDKRYADSEEMKAIFKSYQDELKAIGLAGLEINMRPHARGAEFVGSEKCAGCHSTAYEIWEKTPHAHATETLTKIDPPRQFDAECLSCHVTGWELNPGTYVPYLSGYLSEEKSKHLFGNGCENCHGPGSKHVAVESGELEVAEKVQNDLRAQMRLTLADAEKTCVKCHDPDNSPNFSHEPKHEGDLAGFAEYWKRVEHKGKD